MPQYSVIYYDPFGGYICTIQRFFNLQYSRTENQIGTLTMDLPPIYPAGYFKVDGRLEVYVKEDIGGIEHMEGETQYFIRLVREKTDEDRTRLIHILAHDTIDLIDRRIVPYAAQSAYAKKENNAEAMIKEIMLENFGASVTDAARNLSSWLEIDPVQNQTSISLSKNFPYQKVISVLQWICDESKNTNGQYLTFDIVRKTSSLLQFKTYIGQRGSYRGSSSPYPLVFSYENLGLSYVSIAFDSSTEYNFIYGGGQGSEENRIIQTASDATRIALGPFNRIEDFYPNDGNTADEVLSFANSRLAEAKAKIVFNGHISQRPGLMFGVDYNFGDVVVGKMAGYTFDVHLTSFVRTASENGNSELSIMCRNLDSSEY